MNAITRRAALATAAMGAFTFGVRIPVPGEAAAQTAATPTGHRPPTTGTGDAAKA